MEKAQADEQQKQSMITALRLLAASPKSGQKLREKLKDKGFAEETIAKTLNDLREQGLLDETAYAKDLMARLTYGNAAGHHKIAFELKRHGVPEKIRKELLGSLAPEEEKARALEQARLKWAGWAKVIPQKRKKRLYDFLIRKGYDFQIAQEVLQKLEKDPLNDEI